MSTRVSVIVPCYNYGAYLKPCIDSVVSQRGVDIRVLILDDASDDDTPAIAQGLCDRDARISYVRHNANFGHIPTYNEGLRWADGRYTVLLSADDLLTAGSLHRATTVLDARPDVGLLYGRTLRFYDEEIPTGQVRIASSSARVFDGPSWIERQCRAGRPSIVAPEAIVRTSLQHRLGGYLEALPHTADMEMWMRFAASASVARLRFAPQAMYRQHRQSMQRQGLSTRLASLEHRRQAFSYFFTEWGHAVPEPNRLQSIAFRSLAREALREARTRLDRGDEPSDVDALLSFAYASSPAAATLKEHYAVKWRLKAGPLVATKARPVVDTMLLRRPRAWARWQLRTRLGG